MKLKYAIEFDMRVIEFEAGINFLGKAKIDGVEKNVVCTVTREFLQDISNRSTGYMQTFDNNRFTIEAIAEDHLNEMSSEELQMDPIKIMIRAEDVQSYKI
jgi:hypothetical protein